MAQKGAGGNPGAIADKGGMQARAQRARRLVARVAAAAPAVARVAAAATPAESDGTRQ